jgi:tetratricopeptide (TPR) repeat protein
MRLIVFFMLLAPALAVAQGRYQPQGAAQRAFSEGERLREQGDALRARGELEEAKERYAEALSAMNEARKADPAYIDAIVKLGLLYYSLARHQEALPVLQGGLKRAPEHLDLRFWYGQNLLAAGQASEGVAVLEQVAEQGGERFPEASLVLGEHWYAQKAYDKARPALERYVKLAPDATAARAQLGNTYFKLGLFAEALAAFEAVRLRWPDKVEVQVNIGNSHFQLGQYERAVAVLEAALKQAPDRESVLFNLAQSYFKLGRFGESVPHYQRFVGLRPDSFNGRYFLGSALMELGRDAEALAELARAAPLNAKVAQPTYKMGLIHLRAGRLDEAAAALAQAAQVEPRDPWIKSAQGTLARRRGQLDAAMKVHGEAVALGPKEAKLHANLAVTALAAGNLEVAAAAAEQAQALGRGDAFVDQAVVGVLAARARAQVATDPAAAEALLNQALALVPSDGVLLTNRALVRVAKGDGPGALADAQAAAKARPDDPDTRYALGRARQLSGDTAGAIEALKTALQARPSPAVALAMATAMTDLDAASDLIDESLKSWPQDAGLLRQRALTRYARAAAGLGADLPGRRTATDLRFALEIEDSLPPALAARVRYASAVAALRRGEGKEARAHLTRASALARADGRFLKPGAPGDHLDLLIAFSEVLQKDHESALGRLGACTGALEKRLCKYAWDRVAAAATARSDWGAARKALETSKDLGPDPGVEHNLAVLAWVQKKGRDKVASVWRRLADSVPEAVFNLGVAAEARGEQQEAWQAFSRYGRADGPRANEARDLADMKNRIYRFAEGGE